MAGTIKGITIEIAGNTQPLNKSLEEVNKKTRDVQGELKQVERLLKLDPKNTELLAQKQQLLAEAVTNSKNKLDTLKTAESQVQQQFKEGEIGEEQYRAFQREVVKAEQELRGFESRVVTSKDKAKQLAESVRDAGEKMKGAGEKIKGAGASLSGFVTAPIVAGIGLVTKGTEELRGDLSVLEQNARSAGIGTDAMGEALTRLSGVSTETDSNVEALSNLLATGFDEQGMLQAMDALSGAVIKFPDTLKIEGLADGLQETLATGAATGSFAEMLERMGLNLDTFNAGLAEASEKGQEQNYILEVLADTGLAKVNDEYRKNNEELVRSRESTMDFQQSIAELGETLAPIISALTEIATKMIDKFNSLSPTGKGVVLAVAGIVAAIGPLLTIVGTTITTFGGLITIAGKLGIGISGIAGPIGLAVAAVAGLIAIGVTLYKNWDTIKEKAGQIRDKIANLFSGISWKLPDIKLPHFKVSWDSSGFWGGVGEFVGLPGKPILGVDWYDKGGIFNSPQIIGVGERRPEFVGALDDLRKIFREESGKSQAVTTAGPLLNVENVTITNDMDIQEWATKLAFYYNQTTRATGGV